MSIANAGIQGAGATQMPNTTVGQQRRKAYAGEDAIVSGVSAVNPVIGGIWQLGNAIGRPMRNNADKVNENGDLVNKTKSKNTAILGGIFNPASALIARSQYKGGFGDISGNGYTKHIEDTSHQNIANDIPLEQSKVDTTSSMLNIAQAGMNAYSAYNNMPHSNKSSDESVNGAVDSSVTPQYMQTAKYGGSIIPRFDLGGQTNTVQINAEKGELEVQPDGKIVRELRGFPKHPETGINTQGTYNAGAGNIIVPRKNANQYKTADKLLKDAFINNLQFDQNKREEREKMKMGGKIRRYDNGGGIFGYPKAPVNQNYNFMSTSNNDYNQNLDNSEGYVNNSQLIKPNMGHDNNPNTSNTDWQDGLGYAATYAPTLYNLGRSILDKPYKMDANNYKPSNINAPIMTGDSGRRDIREQSNAVANQIKGLNGSGVMSALVANSHNTQKTLGNFNENLENQNKSSKFAADQFNASSNNDFLKTKLYVDQMNRSAVDNKQAGIAKGIGQLSGDYQTERNNKMMSGVLQDLYKNYEMKNGKWVLKGDK